MIDFPFWSRWNLKGPPWGDLFAVATLLDWQLRQAQEAETAAEAWQTEGHVFTMEDGRALDPAYITRVFQKLRKGPGEELPAMSFHGLRHCAASLMLASGRTSPW
jgi:integrase